MNLPLVTGWLIGSAWLASMIFLGRFVVTLWFTRTAGILTMAFLGSAFGVLSLALASTVLGHDWPGRDGVRLAVYLAINVLLWSCAFLLIRDQHRARTTVKMKD
jgi:hypothetical protein